MSHFSRIFSLVAIINTSSKQLCNQETTSLMAFNSTVSDSLIMALTIGTEVATSHVTWTPLSRSKCQRSRSPDRFTQRCINTWGRCSGDRENVLAVGSYCCVASARRREALGAPTGRGEEGRGILCRMRTACILSNLRYIVSFHVKWLLICWQQQPYRPL